MKKMIKKFFMINFNRASMNALKGLTEKLKNNNMLTIKEAEADYFIACGDRIETFNFALRQFRNDKSIIHLWSGITGTKSHDEFYRHSISLMSILQLCEDENSQETTINLLKSVSLKPNCHIVGSVYCDDLTYNFDKVPYKNFDLVLYNPPLNKDLLKKELEFINNFIKGKNYVWIEPNGDEGSKYINKFVNSPTVPRKSFLGLIKKCDNFITNSSCACYEVPLINCNHKLLIVGDRNKFRSTIPVKRVVNSSNKIIKILLDLGVRK